MKKITNLGCSSGELFIFLKLQLNFAHYFEVLVGIALVYLLSSYCAEYYGDFFSQFRNAKIFFAENAFDLRFFIFWVLDII